MGGLRFVGREGGLMKIIDRRSLGSVRTPDLGQGGASVKGTRGGEAGTLTYQTMGHSYRKEIEGVMQRGPQKTRRRAPNPRVKVRTKHGLVMVPGGLSEGGRVKKRGGNCEETSKQRHADTEGSPEPARLNTSGDSEGGRVSREKSIRPHKCSGLTGDLG